MNIVEIINKKRKGEILSCEEIEYVVTGFVMGDIPDYQMSALLMAICIQGMDDDEIFTLTDCMLKSGDVIDLTSISGRKVDKHSTGGVGDKTTLILLPLVSSVGVRVAKMSGRSLGFTGGTIDKLESIPGFETNLELPQFIEQVQKIGVALASQTGDLVPADKKIYGLRDITGTVESLPLIASSVMSKKLASGADDIVIDLKVGDGALMKTLDEARSLANIMISIGKRYDKKVVCVITDMNQPLGNAIGNRLEVLESIDVLQGKGPKDVEELVLTLGSYMVSLSQNVSIEEAQEQLKNNLVNGKAYQKFVELVETQHGHLDQLSLGSKVFSVKSNRTGFISKIHTEQLGEIVRKIGGGRFQKEDIIDYGVGVVLSKKVGDYVLKDEELLKVYLEHKDIALKEILDCFEIEMNIKDEHPLIYEVIQ